MPIARPTMLASASGELKTRALPNFRCRFAVTLKTPPLPFTFSRYCFARTIGHVFAEHDDARIALHLRVQAAVDQIDHRAGDCRKVRRLSSVSNSCRSRIDVGRINVKCRCFGRRLRTGERCVGGLSYLAIDFVFDLLQLVLIDDAFVDQHARQSVLIGSRSASAVRSSSAR